MARVKFARNGTRSRGELEGRLAPMSLQPVDEARCVLRQDGIRFYGEDQYDAYAGEQLKLHEAEGENEARPHLLVAAATEVNATRMRQALGKQEKQVESAAAEARKVEEALSPQVRRGPLEKPRYYITTAALLLGDVAGVGGAAIALGEEPSLAILQALASGTAAITAGLVGQDVRDSRRARKRARDPRGMPAELRRYAYLFRGADSGESIVKILVGGALTIAFVIAASILALRWSTEGTMAGIVFGGLAAAISLASFLNVYAYTDDVADLIDNAKQSQRAQERKLGRLGRNRSLRRHQKAQQAVESLRGEYRLRGEAAVFNVTASKFLELSQHPGIAGHGYKIDTSEPAASEPTANGKPNNADGNRSVRRTP